MVIVLVPFVWIVRGWKKLRSRTEPSGFAAGPSTAEKKKPPRSVMIEGLPPRTIN